MIVSRFFTWRLNPVCLYIVDTQGTKKYGVGYVKLFIFFFSYLYNALFFRELYGLLFSQDLSVSVPVSDLWTLVYSYNRAARNPAFRTLRCTSGTRS